MPDDRYELDAEGAAMLRELRAEAAKAGTASDVIAVMALQRLGCRMREFRAIDPRVLARLPDEGG